MALEDAPAMLPCGRDPLAVTEHAHTGRPDSHEQSCAHCQAAIAAAGLTRRAAAELAAQPVDVPATLLPGIMRTVWAELRPSATIELPIPGGGVTVSALAVAGALRRDLGQLAALTVHSCQVEPTTRPQPGGAAAAMLAVRITATAAHPAELPALASQARQLIATTLRTQFGLHPASIDIDFTDLDLPPATP